MQHQIQVHYQGQNEILEANTGDLLINIIRQHNIDLNAPCGGEGICGKCKIKILNQENLTPDFTAVEEELLSQRELIAGIRLACQTKVNNDLELEIENEGKMDVLTSGLQGKIKIDPGVERVQLQITEPSLQDQRAYLQRIIDQLGSERIKPEKIDQRILKKLDKLTEETKVTVTIRDGELINITAGDDSTGLYGIAIDIGTTTVALFLLDLSNGKEIDVYSLHNPQQKFGADVISRINYTLNNEHGQEELQRVLLDGLNQGIETLLINNSLQRDEIYSISIVGNTVMLHSLLGINAGSIARAPYIPVFTSSLELKPAELDLKINPQGCIYILPSVSSYIGADIVGDMLAADFEKDDWYLLIDIGTNGEIVLGKKEKILACSAAAGPAFEGANITFGMAGLPGAVSQYTYKQNQLVYQTIGDTKAKGICGSGLVDIIALLVDKGLLNSTGALEQRDNLTVEIRDSLTEYKGMKAFKVLAAEESSNGEEIVLTQKDIREFQLARGAIIAGIRILMKEAGVGFEDIANIYLAGGFGNYIDSHNAAVIGLIPPQLEDRVIRIGNGAGTGARLYLLDKGLKNYVNNLSKRVEYIELSGRADFQMEFMNSMIFKIT